MTDVKAEETPREKFCRLAATRTAGAVKRIKGISSLSATSYKWEPEDAQKILDALFDAVDEVKQRFERKVRGRDSQFTYSRKN